MVGFPVPWLVVIHRKSPEHDNCQRYHIIEKVSTKPIELELWLRNMWAMLWLANPRKQMRFGFKQPLVGEKHCVTTLITAAEETSHTHESLRYSYFAVMWLVCSQTASKPQTQYRKECCSDVRSRFFGGSCAWHPKNGCEGDYHSPSSLIVIM